MNEVSYVVTVYNKARFLDDVLEAILQELKQTGGEIVIVDDGSTDSSPVILEAFAKNRTDVKLISQANRGVAAATNRGLGMASQPFTRLVDGDDRIVAGSTALLLKALEQTGSGFAYGRIQVENHTPLHATGKIHIIDDPLMAMLTRQPFIPSCTLGRTEIMQQVLPLPTDIPTSQDFSLGLKLSALTKFASLNAACCISPAHSGGLSTAKGGMYRDTVLLSIQFAHQQNWPSRLRRLSLQRNAGRARNYLRRHDPGQSGAIATVSAIALLARLPLPLPFTIWMSYVASVYRKGSARQDAHI